MLRDVKSGHHFQQPQSRTSPDCPVEPSLAPWEPGVSAMRDVVAALLFADTDSSETEHIGQRQPDAASQAHRLLWNSTYI